MNPLTLVKRIQKINSTEATLGISEEASWHAKYKDSAYVFLGGVPFDLTEGDLLAVFAQYGEVVDVNLVRDKASGKSKGFAFLAYEDQRSTILAVDNLNGAKILGRIIRVDHVSSYKRKQEEDEENEREKREARGVCRAFQRGECKYGSSCKFSHDEKRCADTGWGAKDDDSRWGNDKYSAPSKSHKNFNDREVKIDEYKSRFRGENGRHGGAEIVEPDGKRARTQSKSSSVDYERAKMDERYRSETKHRERRAQDDEKKR
ncbi:Zinc finger CCCH domain-containing protein 25 [Platanthera guangdongensis]|uniref:Zinc finger CCCH domain-containing protein 25 n=1 Tax=Platanthera guangdongensis TaxID=2320717 RepID=A0ABR2MI62_9ASPA